MGILTVVFNIARVLRTRFILSVFDAHTLADQFMKPGIVFHKSSYLDLRLELMELPPNVASISRRDTRTDYRSRDVGHYHVCLDASRACLSIAGLISSWDERFRNRYHRSICTLVQPCTTCRAGKMVESAMISDSDGNLIEIIRRVHDQDNPSVGIAGSQFEWDDDKPM